MRGREDEGIREGGWRRGRGDEGKRGGETTASGPGFGMRSPYSPLSLSSFLPLRTPTHHQASPRLLPILPASACQVLSTVSQLGIRLDENEQYLLPLAVELMNAPVPGEWNEVMQPWTMVKRVGSGG